MTARGKERKAIFRLLVGNSWEQSHLERLVPPVNWARIIAVVEQAKEERWGEFSGRHGDWGRDAALWLGRGAGRLSLAQLGELAGGELVMRPWGRRLAGLISGC